MVPHHEVIGFLRKRADAMVAAGIERERICVDPAFGFGKTVVLPS